MPLKQSKPLKLLFAVAPYWWT